jgi:2-methylcitrate dehydratase
VEDPQFTRDHHDPEGRSIANALTVALKDGKTLDEVVASASRRSTSPAPA